VTFAADGTSVVISVDDEGPGLTADGRVAVLGPGVRLDERTAGSGLGLAIVSYLSALHGGSLEISRSSKGGLLARLRLPRHTVTTT
jgi:signal transduction histidine kinase